MHDIERPVCWNRKLIFPKAYYRLAICVVTDDFNSKARTVDTSGRNQGHPLQLDFCIELIDCLPAQPTLCKGLHFAFHCRRLGGANNSPVYGTLIDRNAFELPIWRHLNAYNQSAEGDHWALRRAPLGGNVLNGFGNSIGNSG